MLIDRERAVSIQQTFREMDLSKLDSEWVSYRSQIVKKRPEMANIQVADVVLMAKVARAAGEDDFHTFLESGELPPIKLTAEELERMRGGFWGTLAVIGGCIALAGEIWDFGRGLAAGFSD